MEKEARDESQPGGGDISLGVRFTARFLDITAIVMCIPGFGALCFCVQSMKNAVHKSPDVWLAITSSLLFLAGLLAFVGMISGANWLAMVVRAQHAVDRARWPEHPKLFILHPMLLASQAHAAGAVVVWLFVKLIGRWETSWTWLGFWVSFTIAGEVVMRRMGWKGLPW